MADGHFAALTCRVMADTLALQIDPPKVKTLP